MHSGKEVQKRKIPIAKFEFCDEFMRKGVIGGVRWMERGGEAKGERS